MVIGSECWLFQREGVARLPISRAYLCHLFNNYMSAVSVKFKKLVKEAVTPKYAKPGDAAMDLTAISKSYDEYGNIVYGTGLAFEIPEGFFMHLVPRSSNSKTDLVLTNHAGIADSGYRGEIFFKYRKYKLAEHFGNPNGEYEIRDRIGQIMILPYPFVALHEVEELSDSERGTGGYGSTGR